MRREPTFKTGTLTGAADLTIVAPIRKGFVPSLDAVTYKTRVERVLRTLHMGRQAGHEYDFARVLSDAVERVGRIQSIRIAILESDNGEPDKVMLAVTFDGSWESYIRVIWQKVARSLDLIFCNTEDYVLGGVQSFDQWGRWLRLRQAKTPFLYAPANLTFQDMQYLKTYEWRLRQDRDPVAAELAAGGIRLRTAEEVSDCLVREGLDPMNLGLDSKPDPLTTARRAFEQGMRGLASIHRLADVYLPGTPDGDVLHRAACELLREFVRMVTTPDGRLLYENPLAYAGLRFHDALAWLNATPDSKRDIPQPADVDLAALANVQGGIVKPYEDVTDGCLLLLSFGSAAALGDFLAKVKPTSATDTIGEAMVTVNIALALEGLRLAGMTDDEVVQLPEEFVQGMERRAGLLGDVRINHPRRWRLPPLNGTDGPKAMDLPQDDPAPRTDLSSVHLVLQLRLRNTRLDLDAARGVLWNWYLQCARDHAGMQLLSVQWLHRLRKDGAVHEHFGFIDSDSSPALSAADEGVRYPNRVQLGEILVGHDNAADRAPPEGERTPSQELLHDGSFLVVRKLRQDLGAMAKVLDAAAADCGAADDAGRKAHKQLVLAKMMGRWPIAAGPLAGRALANVSANGDNDFSFRNDGDGRQCPFHAHIRRANPRDQEDQADPPGSRPARLIRRSMSYGPVHDPDRAGSLQDERGLVFMTYNASIGEQFEVVQRWLTGGNSSGSFSGQADPFLGLAQAGRPRYFRFEDQSVGADGKPARATYRVRLDGSQDVHAEPAPLVRLEWGMYLFAPSLQALRQLAQRASQAGPARGWSVERGEAEIARLRRIEATAGTEAAFTAWKAAIEDPTAGSEFVSASIWAAIRNRHEGVLRTPYGTLVAGRQMVDQMLQDRERSLTATGYLPRMERSFGTLYLGLDAGHIEGRYERESDAVNEAIMALADSDVRFEAIVAEAAGQTRAAIDKLVKQAQDQAVIDREETWDLTFEGREIVDEVLAHFCESWFGLRERGPRPIFRRGGMHWSWNDGDAPYYPGHFMAPSRYTFQPHPGQDVERIGASHGVAVRDAMARYLDEYGKDLQEPVARAVLGSPAVAGDPGYAARTLAGVMMGFLPTTDGNLRRVLAEWLNDNTLWALRSAYRLVPPGDHAAENALTAKVRSAFVRAMQVRAVPDLLWRAVSRSHVVGCLAAGSGVPVRPGEMVVASLSSATQQCLEEGLEEVGHAFGGRRDLDGHPVHACPGYRPAMALMLGFFEGLVNATQALRAGPAPLSFSIEGRSPVARRAVGPMAVDFRLFNKINIDVDFLAPRIPLLVIGDSWVDTRYDFYRPSLGTALERAGYSVGDGRFRDPGWTVERLATTELKGLRTYLADPPASFQAIFLSAGGNDVAVTRQGEKVRLLTKLLNPKANSAAAALNEDALKAFVDEFLKGHFRALLQGITNRTKVPVLVHGYDHPFPDGTPAIPILNIGPWLKPAFDDAEMVDDLAERTKVMRVLIDRLNAMLKGVAAEFGGQVHHVDFTGIFERDGLTPANFKDYWADELHAGEKGLGLLLQALHKQLKGVGVKQARCEPAPVHRAAP